MVRSVLGSTRREGGAEPFISEVGHRLAGGEWVTDLARVCQALVVFSRNTSKYMG